MDSEGLGSLAQHATFDVQIFALSILLSSLFVLNTQGTINESALEQLELVVHMTEKLRISEDNNKASSSSKASNASSATDLSAFASHFPSFLWVLRDFVLDLVDASGHPITSNAYLESALQPQPENRKNAAEKNRIRETIRSVFSTRECVTLVRPVAEEKDLQRVSTLPETALREQFRVQMHALKQRVLQLSKAKQLEGVTLNGASYVRLAELYINSMNNGKLPVIHTAFANVQELNARDALEHAAQLYQQTLQQLSANNAIVEQDALNKHLQRLQQQTAALLREEALGDETFINNLQQKLNEKVAPFIEQFTQMNQLRSTEQSRVIFEQLWSKAQLEHKAASVEQFSTFVTAQEHLWRDYLKQAAGPAKQEVGYHLFLAKSQQLQKLFWESAQHNKQALQQIQDKLNKAEGTLAELKHTAQSMTHQHEVALTKLQSQLEHKQAELEREKKQQQESEKAAHRAQERYEKQEQALRKEIKTLEQDIHTLRAEKQTVELQLSHELKSVQSTQRSVDEWRHKYDVAHKQNEQHNATIMTLNKQLTELDKQLAQERSERSNLSKRGNEQLSGLEKENNKLNTKLEIAERLKQKHLEEQNALQTTLEQLQKEKQAFQQQIEAYSIQIMELNNKITLLTKRKCVLLLLCRLCDHVADM